MTRRVLVTRPAWTNATTIRQALAEVWGDGTAVLVIGASPRGVDHIARSTCGSSGRPGEATPRRLGRVLCALQLAMMVRRGLRVVGKRNREV